MTGRIVSITCLTMSLLCSSISVVTAQKQSSSGVFVDREQKSHPWAVNEAHTLVWDGAPYIPIGGVFMPSFIAEGSTDAHWERDRTALLQLKEKGLLDILIDPLVSVPDVSPASWQKLVDFLDSQGFRYGLRFGSGIPQVISGLIVKPATYRIEDIKVGLDVTWNVRGATGGYALFVDSREATSIIADGPVRVRDGIVSVAAPNSSGSGMVGILYPRKSISSTREGAFPDFWAGFDRYRDRLLAILSQVKFGNGLRFFLDPLCRPITMQGEIESLLPDSPGFRLEWEAWLSSRYPAIDDLINAWSMVEKPVKDFREAARIVPLFAGGRGVAYFLDTISYKRYEARGNERFWSDLREFRTDSVTYYMNAMANLLKREIANVPVVYTRTNLNRIFTNSLPAGGFDGLGVAATARGSALATSGADSAFSQAGDSQRHIWSLVTETQDAAGIAKGQIGYSNQQSMTYDLDWLRNTGPKGIFVNGFQILPDSQFKNHSLLSVPEQLGWLKQYSDRMGTRVATDRTRPTTLAFPPAAEGIIQPGPIGSTGVWWVPSLLNGRTLALGSSFCGYTLNTNEGLQTVLWSVRGPRLVHILVTDPRKAKVTSASGSPMEFKTDIKKRLVIVTIDSAPIVVSGSEEDAMPLEAIQDTLTDLRLLVAYGEANKIPVSEFKYAGDRAKQNLDLNGPRIAMTVAAVAVSGLINMIQPYSWLEAESGEGITFNDVVQDDAASGGGYISLSADSKPSSSGYGVTVSLSAPVDDLYTVWVACTPPGPSVSPFAWVVDATEPHYSSTGVAVGLPYLSNRFIWVNLGRMRLSKGRHQLTIRVTEQAAIGGKYRLAIDSLLVTRAQFVPSGTMKPPVTSELLGGIAPIDPKKKK